MADATINVAIKKPIHAKLCRLAKAEKRTVRTVTNDLIAEGVSRRERQQQERPAAEN